MILEYTLNSNDTYINVKEVLKAHFKISDRLLQKLKNTKNILLNNEPTYVSKEVTINDTIKVIIDFEEDSTNIKPTKMELDIIYEDDCYLIINKKPGLPVHPSLLHYENSLSNGVKYYFIQIGLHKKIRPVNRLDKDTSGIVIFAKNEYIQECLVKQMKEDTLKKEYIAICEGIFKNKMGIINAPIARKPGSIIERCVDESGDIAITEYKVLQEQNNISIVHCILKTGRTHQIRVHLSHIGHPLIGDTLYGNQKNTSSGNYSKTLDKNINTINNTRQLLHSYKTSFIHPLTKKEVTYIAPLPQDIQKYISNYEL